MSGLGLTARQAELLRFIESCWPVSPTFRQMAAALGLKMKTINHVPGCLSNMLNGLVERGYIRRLKNRAQAIEVLRRAPPIAAPAVQQVPGPWGDLICRYDALPVKPVAATAPYPFQHRTCAEWGEQAEAA